MDFMINLLLNLFLPRLCGPFPSLQWDNCIVQFPPKWLFIPLQPPPSSFCFYKHKQRDTFTSPAIDCVWSFSSSRLASAHDCATVILIHLAFSSALWFTALSWATDPRPLQGLRIWNITSKGPKTLVGNISSAQCIAICCCASGAVYGNMLAGNYIAMSQKNTLEHEVLYKRFESIPVAEEVENNSVEKCRTFTKSFMGIVLQ